MASASALQIPASPPSLPDVAYEHLRSAILDGSLPAGSALRQEEIAARLGISRLPIREALRRLDSEGLVALRPRRGYVVASLDRAEIDDVLELLATLEASAGHSATLKKTDARRTSSDSWTAWRSESETIATSRPRPSDANRSSRIVPASSAG